MFKYRRQNNRSHFIINSDTYTQIQWNSTQNEYFGGFLCVKNLTSNIINYVHGFQYILILII